jgi:hypothetical protein
MNTEAIHFVAQAILAQNTVLPNGERLKFDMKNWCGTACCIAGWTNALIGSYAKPWIPSPLSPASP